MDNFGKYILELVSKLLLNRTDMISAGRPFLAKMLQ